MIAQICLHPGLGLFSCRFDHQIEKALFHERHPASKRREIIRDPFWTGFEREGRDMTWINPPGAKSELRSFWGDVAEAKWEKGRELKNDKGNVKEDYERNNSNGRERESSS